MINKVTFNNNSVINWGGNISTRKLVELAEREGENSIRNGRPVVEKLKKDKLDRVIRFKRRHGDSIYQIYRSCTRKVKRYANELLAEKAAHATERRFGVKFSTYHCPVCEQWHICKAVNKFIKSWD